MGKRVVAEAFDSYIMMIRGEESERVASGRQRLLIGRLFIGGQE